MKVSDLIHKLQAVSPDCEVVTVVSHYNGHSEEWNDSTLILLADSASDTVALIPEAALSFFTLPANVPSHIAHYYPQWLEL